MARFKKFLSEEKEKKITATTENVIKMITSMMEMTS